MDFGFCPGQTDWENVMRRVFDRRINTQAVTPLGATSIQEFLRFVNTNTTHSDDLLVGSHATNEGVLFLDLDSQRSGHPATYEDLEAVALARTIEIPGGVGSSNSRFHVKGCRIGSDVCRPYLTLLKSALGDRKPVTAPKFFHGLFPRNATDRDAIFEWMAYSYEVNAKTPFSDHAHLIKALQDQHFKRLDGTPVADADIDTWVDRSLQLTPTSKHVVTVVLPVLIVPAMGTISALAKFNGQCRSERDTYTYQATSGVPVPQNQTALKTALQQVDNLKPTHPYPIFRRLLFATFDDFFNGKDWVQQRNGDWIGTHFIYTLVIPIMKIEMPPPPPPAPPPTPVAPNELIFNFYPPIGGGAPTMHFLEDNPTFFGKV